MTSARLASFAIFLAAPLAAQAPAPPSATLSLQQSTALRCAAAFALGAAAQGRGEHADWPPLTVRGREFMVQSSARIMDETGWSREQVAARLSEQARVLSDPVVLKDTMGPCLLLLDASGL